MQFPEKSKEKDRRVMVRTVKWFAIFIGGLCTVIVIGAIASIAGGGKPTTAPVPEAANVADLKSFGYSETEWVSRMNRVIAGTPLPEVRRRDGYTTECKDMCATQYTQGKNILFMVSSTRRGEVAGIVMALTSNGDESSGVELLVSVVAFANATVNDLGTKTGPAVGRLIEGVEKGRTASEVIGNVKFQATAPKGLGLWITASPKM